VPRRRARPRGAQIEIQREAAPADIQIKRDKAQADIAIAQYKAAVGGDRTLLGWPQRRLGSAGAMTESPLRPTGLQRDLACLSGKPSSSSGAMPNGTPMDSQKASSQLNND